MELGEFEGSPITGTGLECNLGGGLKEAMGVDPIVAHKGDRIVVVVECEVKDIKFRAIKDSNAVHRVHVLTPLNGTVVDRDLVATVLDEQAKRIEEAEGVQQIPFNNPDGDLGEDREVRLARDAKAAKAAKKAGAHLRAIDDPTDEEWEAQ